MEITIKIDQRKKEAQALIDYLKSLSYVEVKEEPHPQKAKSYLNNLKKIAPEMKKQSASKTKGKSLQSLIDEL